MRELKGIKFPFQFMVESKDSIIASYNDFMFYTIIVVNTIGKLILMNPGGVTGDPLELTKVLAK